MKITYRVAVGQSGRLVGQVDSLQNRLQKIRELSVLHSFRIDVRERRVVLPEKPVVDVLLGWKYLSNFGVAFGLFVESISNASR